MKKQSIAVDELSTPMRIDYAVPTVPAIIARPLPLLQETPNDTPAYVPTALPRHPGLRVDARNPRLPRPAVEGTARFAACA